MSEEKSMHFSDQAMGALMMALQNSLLNQTDIVPVLKNFEFKLGESGLVVMNPPIVKLNSENTQSNTDAEV